MDKISISTAKKIREELNATHIVIFAVGNDGQQHIATYGKTGKQAREAAKAGNKLKSALGWPEDLCKSIPLSRQCKNCVFWKADYGIFCFNGWSGDGSTGFCRLNPQHIQVVHDNLCSFFEPNA